MSNNLNKKLKIFLNWFAGPILFIWLSFSIYNQINSKSDLRTSWEHIKTAIDGEHQGKLIMVIVLMFVNWGLEARKWQLLLQKIQPISFIRAFKSILTGQAFALNTINRVGEYVGRVMYLDEGKRLKSISLSIAGSFSQIIITMVMGVIGMIYLRYNLLLPQKQTEGLNRYWIDGLIYAIGISATINLFLYYKLSLVVKFFEKLKILRKYKYLIEGLGDLHWRELTRILILSFIRYIVYVIQYLLLLQVFDVSTNWVQAGLIVCVMFLVMALIPTIALAELGFRAKASVELLGLISGNLLGIIATAGGIWLINLVIPAVAGSLFIFGMKIFKKTNN